LTLVVRRLGVDYGRRRTGLALSDEESRLASPLEILECRGMDDLAARIRERAAAHAVSEIVLGNPVREDGSPGTLADEIEDLAARLRSRGLAVVLWDESLTSWEAETRLREAGAFRRAKRGVRPRIDAAAAAVMLQSYLESLPR
jgi:putative Holliday junction resolvase